MYITQVTEAINAKVPCIQLEQVVSATRIFKGQEDLGSPQSVLEQKLERAGYHVFTKSINAAFVGGLVDRERLHTIAISTELFQYHTVLGGEPFIFKFPKENRPEFFFLTWEPFLLKLSLLRFTYFEVGGYTGAVGLMREWICGILDPPQGSSHEKVRYINTVTESPSYNILFVFLKINCSGGITVVDPSSWCEPSDPFSPPPGLIRHLRGEEEFSK